MGNCSQRILKEVGMIVAGVMMRFRRIAFFAIVLSLVVNSGVLAKDITGKDALGPQSSQGIGKKNVLMVVVRFPDVAPTMPIETVKRRVVSGFNAYVLEQSYGLASIIADFRGYVMLPETLSHYKVSQYNFLVDRGRVRKLIEDTMTAMEKDVDFSSYDHMLIVPAVHTLPGKGYGMICYCANPGMLSGVIGRNIPRFETLRSAGGKEFRGGIFVGTENANLGMFAHDYFHALGGVHEGKRLVPCLYDYERQSNASAGVPSFEHHAVYMGPWDIMSQHFIRRGEPPPGVSSFTKIRLGWIKGHQVRGVKPRETSLVFLSPLSKGGDLLAVKLPLEDGTYYLIENRQPIGFDRALPDSGILVLKVNPEATEGYGTVEVKIPGGSRSFNEATYKPGVMNRSLFLDKKNNIAVIPIWRQEERLGVLVTTPDKSEAAIKAGLAIQALIEQNPETPNLEKETVILEAITVFKNGDFERSHAIAAKGHKGR
jgi:M6 family metalloprotease-like protein